jgi:hypothetical protein
LENSLSKSNSFGSNLDLSISYRHIYIIFLPVR